MYTFEKHQQINWTSHVALVVMNPLEDPLEKGMVTHSVILPGEFYGQRSLEGYSPWGCKKSDMTKVTENTCSHNT